MKKVPTLKSDEEAEAFLDQDLSDLDFSQFKRINWEAQPKTARITMRVPQALMDALKAKAKERGIPYQRLVREAIERVV
jgi:predicted DNA binding CopG/RHH family protein